MGHIGYFGLPLATALVGVIFALSYRWIRGRLGEADPDPIPMARLRNSPRHGGFNEEPSWLRPMQSIIIAAGLTIWTLCILAFVAVGLGALIF